MQAGRWDIVRPVRAKTAEEIVEAGFDRCLILSRETAAACGISWQEALRVLRIWEYTGQARRGYFVQGMSGAQFIRKKDYASVIKTLNAPDKKLIWINAADPAQCWGKILPHKGDRSFLNIPGNAVACFGGVPVAVMERQGKILRIFDEALAEDCMKLFAQEFKRHKLFPSLKRIVVKEYPQTATEALTAAGFGREMKDYVLYQ